MAPVKTGPDAELRVLDIAPKAKAAFRDRGIATAAQALSLTAEDRASFKGVGEVTWTKIEQIASGAEGPFAVAPPAPTATRPQASPNPPVTRVPPQPPRPSSLVDDPRVHDLAQHILLETIKVPGKKGDGIPIDAWAMALNFYDPKLASKEQWRQKEAARRNADRPVAPRGPVEPPRYGNPVLEAAYRKRVAAGGDEEGGFSDAELNRLFRD